MFEKILTTGQISSEVLRIIRESREFCLVVSPLIQPWPELNTALNTAHQNSIPVGLILNANQQNKDYYRHISAEFGLECLFIDNLHIRLCLNEHEALLGSMNICDSRNESGHELAIVHNSAKTVRELTEHLMQTFMIDAPALQKTPGSVYVAITRYYSTSEQPGWEKVRSIDRDLSQQKKAAQKGGFCIACKQSIPTSVYRTLCEPCYQNHNAHNSLDGKFGFCHLCGCETSVSKTRPLCYSCYTDLDVW